MTIHYEDDAVRVFHGDCLEVLRGMADNSVDAVVTDPPYSYAFMSRDWDSHETPLHFQQWCEQWAAECLRVLEPGGHMLAFGGTRTWHRLACAVEDAGFEVRDSIAWLYGSGFPKSLDVSKAIDKVAGAERDRVPHIGKGLAPGHANGSGGNLMGGAAHFGTRQVDTPATPAAQQWQGWGTALKPSHESIVCARKPLGGTVASNVLQFGTGALNIDVTRVGARWPTNAALNEDAADSLGEVAAFFPVFKYQAKAPSSERPKVNGIAHPTCKPVTLMRWLVRLVTPPGGVVLDPFAGSGTTIEAAILEGFRVIGIEREADYLPLIEARIARNRTTETPTTAAADALALFDIEEPA